MGLGSIRDLQRVKIGKKKKQERRTRLVTSQWNFIDFVAFRCVVTSRLPIRGKIDCEGKKPQRPALVSNRPLLGFIAPDLTHYIYLDVGEEFVAKNLCTGGVGRTLRRPCRLNDEILENFSREPPAGRRVSLRATADRKAAISQSINCDQI